MQIKKEFPTSGFMLINPTHTKMKTLKAWDRETFLLRKAFKHMLNFKYVLKCFFLNREVFSEIATNSYKEASNLIKKILSSE